MKLFFAKPSPFARRIRLLIRERAIQNEVLEIAVSPFDSPAELLAINPASKVPALVTTGGQLLSESHLIAIHLDAQGAAPSWVPTAQDEGLLHTQGLAEGLTSAAWLAVMEGRRDEALRVASWVERQRLAMTRSLASLEATATLSGRLSYAHLVLASALGYLDFRLSDLAWRAQHPRVAAWYQEFAMRPSMVATAP